MRDVVLRKQKDRLMTPLAEALFTAVHPNWISFVALLAGITAAWAVWQQLYWWGLAFWAANRILDGLDGVVARVHQKQSDFGGYLDLMLDYIIYLAVPLALVAAQPTPFHFWALLALFSSYAVNLLSWTTLSAILEKRRWQIRGPVTPQRLTTMEMPTGLIEGAETIIFYTFFLLLPGSVGWLFLVMAVLVLFTAGQRIWWAYRNL